MKKIGLMLLGFAAISLLAYSVKAITVNPASAVTADSAATALTLVYRDASANFAANAITAASIVATSNNQGAVYTKAQIDALVPSAAGQVIVCSNCTVPDVLCVSTGTAASQYVAMKTGNGCGTNN